MTTEIFESAIACGIIVFFGVVSLIAFLKHNKTLKNISQKVKECYTITEKEVKEASINSIKRKRIIEESENFDAIDVIRKEYNEISAKVEASIQMISLFPMLGLLGTVIGIIMAMNNVASSKEPASMGEFGIALWTTVAGLVCAMVLKSIAIKSSMKYMDEIEAALYESDRRYNMLISRGKISGTNETDVVEE